MKRLLIIFMLLASVVQLSANNSPFDDMKKTWDSLSQYRLVSGTKALIQGWMGKYGLEIIFYQFASGGGCSACNNGIAEDFNKLRAGDYSEGLSRLAKRCTTIFGMSYASYYLLRHCCWPNVKHALAIR